MISVRRYAAARARLGLVALLFAVAIGGWWWTAGQIRGMDEGPWTHLGTFGWFLGVWVVMMAAMMFPSVSPTVALYSRMTRQRSTVLPLLFTAGYLVTWAGAGVVAFGVAGVIGRLSGDSLEWGHAGRWAAGITLVVAAAYELTPMKDVCLGKCRSPLGFLLGSWRDGPSARSGWASRTAPGAWDVAGHSCSRFRARHHEHHLDGRRCRAHRVPEDGAMAAGSRPYGTAAVLVCLGLLVLCVPGSVPGLTTPSSMDAPVMQMTG